MPGKLSPDDEDDLIRRYTAGEGAMPLAAEFGVNRSTVRDVILRNGAEMRTHAEHFAARVARGEHPHRRADLDTAAIVALYREGRSIKHLASRFGCDPHAIEFRLREQGVPLRSTEAARAGIDRQRAAERTAKTKRSTTHQVGTFEDDLLIALLQRGEHAQPQHPVGSKNIDIAIGTVAVEVWLSASHPHRDRYCRERIEYLGDRGWSTLYVHISRRTRRFDLTAVADQVVAFREFTETNPAPRGQHRMIRGSGQLAATLSLDPHPGT